MHYYYCIHMFNHLFFPAHQRSFIAFLANGTSIHQRINSAWPNIIDDNLTYRHAYVNTQGKSDVDEHGEKVQLEIRTLPSLGWMENIWKAMQGMKYHPNILVNDCLCGDRRWPNMLRSVIFSYIFLCKGNCQKKILILPLMLRFPPSNHQ